MQLKSIVKYILKPKKFFRYQKKAKTLENKTKTKKQQKREYTTPKLH